MLLGAFSGGEYVYVYYIIYSIFNINIIIHYLLFFYVSSGVSHFYVFIVIIFNIICKFISISICSLILVTFLAFYSSSFAPLVFVRFFADRGNVVLKFSASAWYVS